MVILRKSEEAERGEVSQIGKCEEEKNLDKS